VSLPFLEAGTLVIQASFSPGQSVRVAPRVSTMNYMAANPNQRAGQYADKLTNDRLLKSLGFGAISAVCALAVLYRGPLLIMSKDPVSLALFASAAVFGSLSKKWMRSSKRAMRGADSERTVGKTLERAKLGHVIHGLDLGAGGDADHMLIGHVLAVVETKTGRGEVSYKDGSMSAGSRTIPGDPVRQAQRQAAAARRYTGQWANAIVCVPGMTNHPFRAGDGETIVCSEKDLIAVLRSLPQRLTSHEADAAQRTLLAKTGRT